MRTILFLFLSVEDDMKLSPSVRILPLGNRYRGYGLGGHDNVKDDPDFDCDFRH